MKTFTSLIFTILISNVSSAGIATTYMNNATDFFLVAKSHTPVVSICDIRDNCLDFQPINSNIYKEVNGKCEISITHFSKNFATGKTKNDFMLRFGLQVVEVIKDEDNCSLETETSGQRSITGIYK